MIEGHAMNVNELKIIISEVLEEAKKKLEKGQALKVKSPYGTYAEALDFSWPLGAYNLYKQQGGVTWGPMTSDGPRVDQNFANPNTRGMGNMNESEEQVIRQIVREVIAHGL